MRTSLKSAGMIGAMVVSWSIYYAVSKFMVSATGSAYLAGFLLRSAALNSPENTPLVNLNGKNGGEAATA